MTGSSIFSTRATRILLFLVAFALSAIGILFVHSTMALEEDVFPGVVARKQIAKLVVAIVALLVVLRVDSRFLERRAYVVYGGVVAILSVLLAFKYLRGDASPIRWIRFALFDVQPSELMKLAVILGLARYLRYREDQRQLRGLALPYLLTVVPMGLVLLQPDLGTSLMFPPVLLALLFVAGAKRRYLAVTVVLGIAALPTAYFLHQRSTVSILRDYQMRRLTAYFEQGDPAVRNREAYHLDQSEVALGNGGLFGRGYGEGSQNTLDHLPAKHTDFIFSVIGEEWGFVGAVVVVLLFLLLVLLCLRVAIFTKDPFGRLVAAGVGVVFAAQSFQNIGMAMGLTPITGLPLPFVSYGGSSLVSSFLALGFVLRVAGERVTPISTRGLSPRETPRVVSVEDDRPDGSLAAQWPTSA